LQACVENGTHYCDLTGEPNFIKRCIDEFHDAAADKQVKIVNCCGFDSVPSDVTTILAAHHMRTTHNKSLGEANLLLVDGALLILLMLVRE
jgi:short subunit dehydrogenase-like uncharacterized protein